MNGLLLRRPRYCRLQRAAAALCQGMLLTFGAGAANAIEPAAAWTTYSVGRTQEATPAPTSLRIGIGDLDGRKAMAVDAAGNVYVTGYSDDGDPSSSYAVTIKYDAAGIEQWRAVDDDPADLFSIGYALKVDGSGNVYVIRWGPSADYSASFFTIKYNAAGVRQWKLHPQSQGGDPFAIDVDKSGNVYVTGSTGSDALTVKYNSAGVEQWARTARPVGSDYAAGYSIAIDSHGNVVVAGITQTGPSSYDYVTIKYSSAGKELWMRTANGGAGAWSTAFEVGVDKDDNIVVTGWNRNSEYVTNGGLTVKYDPNGNVKWRVVTRDPANAPEEFVGLAFDSNANVYAVGWTYEACCYRSLIVKFNAKNGAELWRSLGPAEEFSGSTWNNVAVDSEGNVLVVGDNYNGTSFEGVVAKYSASGAQQWRFVHDRPDSDVYYGIGVGPDGSVYAGGRTEEPGQPTAIVLQRIFELPVVQFAVAAVAVDEGAGTLKLSVQRTGGASSKLGPVSVSYTTVDDSAIAGSDYVAASGTLNWAAGDTSPKTITIGITKDTIKEATESFKVQLSAPVGATLGANALETVTIKKQ